MPSTSKGAILVVEIFPKGSIPKRLRKNTTHVNATQAPRHMLYQALDDLKLQETMAATPPAAPTPAPKVAAKAPPKAQPKVAAKAPVLSRQVEHWHDRIVEGRFLGSHFGCEMKRWKRERERERLCFISIIWLGMPVFVVNIYHFPGGCTCTHQEFMRFQLRTLEWSLVPKPLLSMPFWRKPVQAYARLQDEMKALVLWGIHLLRSPKRLQWYEYMAPRNYFLFFCFFCFVRKRICQLHILWIRQLDEKLEALPISRSCQGCRVICSTMVHFSQKLWTTTVQKIAPAGIDCKDWHKWHAFYEMLWNCVTFSYIHWKFLPSKAGVPFFVSRRTLELPFSTPSRVGSVGESFTTTCPCTGGIFQDPMGRRCREPHLTLGQLPLFLYKQHLYKSAWKS